MRQFVVVFFLGVLVAPTAISQTFGVSTGANFQRLSEIRLNELETKFSSQNGWHVGLWGEVPLGPAAALRGGGRYMAAGQLFDGLEANFPSIREKFEVSLVELYLLLRIGFPSQVVSPYVFAGPVFRIPVNTDQQLANDLSALSYAGEIGGGLVINLGPISLYPEVAYVFGLTRFIEDELVLEFISLTVGDTQRLNTAMLRLSIGF